MQDCTLDPVWLQEQQDRFLAWELLQRALRGEADEPMSDKQWKAIQERCAFSEAEYHAMIQDNRKRLREGGCPEGMRLMDDAK